MTRPHRLTVALAFAGALLLQLVWVVATPPFRGMDEPDHAYRAEAVAAGHWTAVPQAAGYDGRGDLVRARASMVRAAYPVCRSYDYVAESDCRPARTFADGTVLVASGAAHYDPLYYWVVGTATASLDGTARLYAMRVLDALLCSGLVAMAVWCTTLWARSTWPPLGVLLCCTPVALYSGATAAPNGPEMFAAITLWSALLGLRVVAPTSTAARTLLRAALAPALLLGTLRTFGPVWLALVVVAAVCLLGWARTRDLVRAHLRLVAATVVLTGVTTAAAAAYTVLSGANSLAAVVDQHYPDTVRRSLFMLPIWVFQTIGAFPDKIDPGPVVMYAAGFALLGWVLARGWWRGERRDRLVLAGIVTVSFLLPLVITLRTYEAIGAAWQGRYTWPLAAGAVLVATATLDRGAADLGRRGATTLVLVFLVPLQLPGALVVLADEKASGPMASSSAWWSPQPSVVASLGVLGLLAWLAVLHCSRSAATARPASAPALPVAEPLTALAR